MAYAPTAGATWPNIDQRLDARGVPHGEPTFAQTECGTPCGHSPTSLHPRKTARDYGDRDTPGGDDGCDRIYRELEPFAQGPDYILQELFWNRLGCWQRGARIGPVSGHWDHDHGALRPGALLPIPAPLPPPKPTYFPEEEEAA